MTDWTVLHEEGVRQAAERAARRVSTEYSNFVEYDDMYQEACIVLAADHVHVRQHLAADKLDWIRYELYRKLCDLADKEFRRRRHDVPRIEVAE